MNERAVRCEREGRDAWAACTGLLAMCAQHAVSLACLLCGPWPIWGGLALCMLCGARRAYMELYGGVWRELIRLRPLAWCGTELKQGGSRVEFLSAP